MKSSHKRLLSLCLSLALLLILFPIFNAIAADAASGTCTSGHSYETVVTAPTCTEDGITTSTCTVCGDVLTGTIPATGHQLRNGVCIHCGETETIASGKCGNNATWKLDSTGTLTISGSGTLWGDEKFEEFTDYSVEPPWDSYRSQIKNIIIQKGITSIPIQAFSKCSNLTTVSIPMGVKTIGSHAFSYCSSLTTVSIPVGVKTINSHTFLGCTSLTAISIPEGVVSIGREAFSNCSSLSAITIPESVKTIDYSAFYNCYSLTNVTLPESLTYIGGAAFCNCSSLTTITIPESVKTINYSTFFNCTKLANITLPANLTSIGARAFYCCFNLRKIIFIGSAPSIEYDCFYGVTATAYYSCMDSSWTSNLKQNYRGNLTWVGHLYSPYEADPSADCTEPVSITRTCTLCGDVIIDTIPAAGHQFATGVWIKHPTCQENGQKSYTCNICGFIKYVTFPTIEHNAVIDPAVPATCTNTGLTEGTHCGSCNEILTTQEVIPVLDHSYQTVIVNPTCTEDGSITTTCTACGDTLIGTVPATSHQFENGNCVYCGEMEQTTTVPGDASGDGKVNMADVAKVFAHVRNNNELTDETALLCADVTGDGKINMADVARIFAHTRRKNPLF